MTLDWENLPFFLSENKLECTYLFSNGKWEKIAKSDSVIIPIHIAATALHYGQEAFEGLKAFRGKDRDIRIFRPEENAKRMQKSARRSLMAVPPVELFVEAVKKVVLLNTEYLPPYESGASLYIRPLLIGTGVQVGVKPANEYLLLVFVTPVGSYFKGGFTTSNVVIMRNYDRAAPKGTGAEKLGGNYAAGILPDQIAQKNGFSTVLYLDAKEKKYIDECGPANFFAIKGKTYITPESDSILPSITNMSLQQLAKDMGMRVEKRKIKTEELKEFDEAWACGTAAVISPINKIVDVDKNIEYVFGEKPGMYSTKLYNKLRAIQYGDEKDIYNWVTVVK